MDITFSQFLRHSQLDLPDTLDAEQFLADGRRASSRSPVKTRSPSRAGSVFAPAPAPAPALASTPTSPPHLSSVSPAAVRPTRSPAKGEPQAQPQRERLPEAEAAAEAEAEPEVIVIDEDEDEAELMAAARESLAEYLHETQLAPLASASATDIDTDTAAAECKPAGAPAPAPVSLFADDEHSQGADGALDLQLLHPPEELEPVDVDGEPPAVNNETEEPEDSLPAWPIDAQHEFDELLQLSTRQLLLRLVPCIQIYFTYLYYYTNAYECTRGVYSDSVVFRRMHNFCFTRISSEFII